MKGESHIKVTELAFNLLHQHDPAFILFSQKSAVAAEADAVDRKRDLEFVDVEGGLFGHGRDDPHKDEAGAIDDKPHYKESNLGPDYYFTCFNHFIDINKGRGKFDDHDGYSYKHGSGSSAENQTVASATDGWFSFLMSVSALKNWKVDNALNWWFNDEYVHHLGRPWYRACSPSVERYSYWHEKKGTTQYTSLKNEAKARMPTAKSTGAKNRGIPYTVFMPVDNMARYWYTQYLGSRDSLDLGYVLHAIQDASIPHHAASTCGNWHGKYEKTVNSKLKDVWRNQQTFKDEVLQLYNEWMKTDANPPNELRLSSWNRSPRRNWRIDFLVTWLAFQAFRSYTNDYNRFNGGWSFVEASARELTKMAVAMSMVVLRHASSRERCMGYNLNNANVVKVGNHWTVTAQVGMFPVAIETFGSDDAAKAEAEKCLEVLRYYGFNTRCVIGQSQITLRYYKKNGRAIGTPATGSHPDEKRININPNAITVEKVANRWTVKTEGETFLDFALEEDARRTAGVIMDNGFSRYCYLGNQAEPYMEFFLKDLQIHHIVLPAGWMSSRVPYIPHRIPMIPH